jgi:nicotinate phosphoribosyltransferase
MKLQCKNPALLTDLYEFTMAEACYQSKMSAPATFSLFTCEYPPDRGYFVNAGLEEVLQYLCRVKYLQDDLDYLKTTRLFSDEFLHYLSRLKFSGDVYAMPEGRLFFKDEPVLEVTAPIIEGQLMERFIAIERPSRYPVRIAPGLETSQRDAIHEVIEKELGES